MNAAACWLLLLLFNGAYSSVISVRRPSNTLTAWLDAESELHDLSPTRWADGSPFLPPAPRLIPSLPNEVSNAILRHLPDSDLGNVRLVSRAADGLVQQDATLPYWQRLLRRELAKTVKTASEKLHYLYEMRRYARHCQEMLFIHVDSSLTSALLSKYDKLFLMHDVQFGLIGDVSRLAIERLRTLIGLDLSYLSLTSIDHLRLPTSLKRLDLSRNKMASMEGVSLPEGLEALVLDDNALETLDVPFAPNLRHLNASYNPIRSSRPLPPLLETLKLRGNSLRSLDAVDLPSTLSSLDVAGNPFRVLDGTLLPPQLRSLDLSSINIGRLNHSILLPKTLQSLLLSRCNLVDLHAFVLPSSLRVLDVSGNRHVQFAPGELPPNLIELDVSYNARSNWDVPLLPPSLRILRAPACGRDELTGFHHLVALEELDLSCNHLSTIPDLGACKNLKSLNLAANGPHHAAAYRWRAFSMHQNGAMPPNLQHLDVSRCGLTSLESLQLPKKLISLVARYNRLHDLFGLPPQLQELDVAGNDLKSTLSITSLDHLQTVNLADNALSHLPQVYLPPSVTKVDLSDNGIRSLHELRASDRLQHLCLAENPIKSLRGFRAPRHLQSLDMTSTLLINFSRAKLPAHLHVRLLKTPMALPSGVRLAMRILYTVHQVRKYLRPSWE